MSDEIVKWGDNAQYVSAPMKTTGVQVRPEAHLLWATPDPLGAIAAAARMYKGIPTYDLSEITDSERKLYWEETFKSHLRAPHEYVQFHFFVEGVTRSHTHQMVRQRTATFSQESLRFAVKENLAQETPLPPSIAEGTAAATQWIACLERIQAVYDMLVNSGIPAEDARGLLPHATTTRLHWRTGLNDLLHHAGNRLCTQAQFEWRILMVSIMKAIREHGRKAAGYRAFVEGSAAAMDPPSTSIEDSSWQWEEIGRAQPHTFAPICYQTGKCEFKAIFDRPCAIRDRVDAFAEHGVSSTKWSEGAHVKYVGEVVPGTGGERVEGGRWIPGINYEEWLMNPDAAR